MDDVKEALYWCLSIPNKVKNLERLKSMISKRFYEEASLINSSLCGSELDNWQRGLKPDQAVMLIIQREETAQKKINILNQVYKLFLDYIGRENINTLLKYLSASELSEYEQKAYKELQEIRSYIFFRYYGSELDQSDYVLSGELDSLSSQLEGLIEGLV